MERGVMAWGLYTENSFLDQLYPCKATSGTTKRPRNLFPTHEAGRGLISSQEKPAEEGAADCRAAASHHWLSALSFFHAERHKGTAGSLACRSYSSKCTRAEPSGGWVRVLLEQKLPPCSGVGLTLLGPSKRI